MKNLNKIELPESIIKEDDGQEIMTDKEVLEILWNQEIIDNEKLDTLLYRLFHSADLPDEDSLQKYSHLTWYDFDRKMADILTFICNLNDLYECNFRIWDVKDINNSVIIDQVGVLPEINLIEFLEGTLNHYYISVDYEAPNQVDSWDFLRDVLEYTYLKKIINNTFNQDDINKVIEFIDDLDLFDIELYKLYNEV